MKFDNMKPTYPINHSKSYDQKRNFRPKDFRPLGFTKISSRFISAVDIYLAEIVLIHRFHRICVCVTKHDDLRICMKM